MCIPVSLDLSSWTQAHTISISYRLFQRASVIRKFLFVVDSFKKADKKLIASQKIHLVYSALWMGETKGKV